MDRKSFDREKKYTDFAVLEHLAVNHTWSMIEAKPSSQLRIQQ
jgi:hypothetical protein